jgi:hypothetical protein
MDLRAWARRTALGAIEAAIHSAAGAMLLMVIAPNDYDPFAGADVRRLLKVIAAFAIVWAFVYRRTRRHL